MIYEDALSVYDLSYRSSLSHLLPFQLWSQQNMITKAIILLATVSPSSQVGSIVIFENQKYEVCFLFKFQVQSPDHQKRFIHMTSIMATL